MRDESVDLFGLKVLLVYTNSSEDNAPVMGQFHFFIVFYIYGVVSILVLVFLSILKLY